MCQFSSKMSNFHFFHSNLPKKEFWVWNFEKLCPDPKSAYPRYYVCQFSGKTDNFEFSASIWRNCPITCNILVLITFRVFKELGGGLNELGGGRWSWVDVEMSWVLIFQKQKLTQRHKKSLRKQIKHCCRHWE